MESEAQRLQFNGLSAAEAERLFLLSEELGEVQQAIGKVLRHGYQSFNPYDPTKTTNKRHLEHELGHVLTSMAILQAGGDINESEVQESADRKLYTVSQYLHHQGNQ